MRRVIELNLCRVADLNQKALPVGVRFTKDFDILLSEFARNPPPYMVEFERQLCLVHN